MVHIKLCQISRRMLNSKKFNIHSCLQLRFPAIISESNRSYLTNAYKCDDKWGDRFEDSLIKNVKPTEFYYDILRKYKSEGIVAPVDADIFLNSITKKTADELTEELEEIVRLLRRSPKTVDTLPSTAHAFIRVVLDTQKYDLLLKVLTDPLNYGVFLDYYTSNLLMDTFLKEENYTAAARIAAYSMLQEDYGPPLTKTFVMLSCFKYIFSDKENEPWIDYHKVIEPEEEVKILVRYVRNPYFDDHFDLRDSTHIVGKTLAWLSFHLEDEAMKAHSEILGWSLFEKWTELESSLKELHQRKQKLDEIVVSKVNDQISKCQDSQMNAKLSSLMSDIAKEDLVSNFDIIGKIEENVKKCVTNYEKDFIDNQKIMYDEWKVKRMEAIEKHKELMERERLIQEIKSKKEDLERRNDVIFYFDNQNHFDLINEKKIRVPKEFYIKRGKKVYYKKKEEKVVDDSNYYPPEV